MSEEAENVRWLTPTKVGFALTALVLAGFAFMAWRKNCILLASDVLECRTNWAWFLSSPPNELGDTLAGFAGALAFVWIIITVWIQGHELREQRKELELTRSELKLAREAQEKQLEVMQMQADIFEDEKIARNEDRARRELDESLNRIGTQIFDLTLWPLKWKYANERTYGSVFDPDGSITFLKPDELAKSSTHHRYFERWLRLLEFRHQTAAKFGSLIEKCRSDALIEIRKSIVSAIQIEDRLGSDQKIRLSVLRLHECLTAIDRLLGIDIWESESP